MDIHKSNINNISEYLNDPQTALGAVIHKAKALQDLYHRLSQELASEFHGHFWIGTYQKGVLSILVDSAILATKLRFATPGIRDKLRKDVLWFELSAIEVKVMVTMPTVQPSSSLRAPSPASGESAPSVERMRGIELSSETRTQIENIADDLEKIPGSQEIANALRGIVTISQAD